MNEHDTEPRGQGQGMTLRERIADWITGGKYSLYKYHSLRLEYFAHGMDDANARLDRIAAMETPKANATAKRMARKDALAELIAKVEVGELTFRGHKDFPPLSGSTAVSAFAAYNGSLDAAMSLRVSILPWPVPEKIHSDARKELLSILREFIALEQAGK